MVRMNTLINSSIPLRESALPSNGGMPPFEAHAIATPIVVCSHTAFPTDTNHAGPATFKANSFLIPMVVLVLMASAYGCATDDPYPVPAIQMERDILWMSIEGPIHPF